MNPPILNTTALAKRYGRHTALTDITLTVPSGSIVGLVGPNGAGKSTLLALTSGLIRPTAGTIEVLGSPPAADTDQLAKVGFVAQDTPVYAALTVDEHLRMGRRLNPRWDQRLAHDRIEQIGLDPAKKAGRLSGGQKAQLALTIAAAKCPELLIFDEPVAALDPLARRAFLQNLMEFVADLDVSVILSSHLLSDVERVCDHLIVLAESRLQIAGDTEELIADHHRLVGPRGDLPDLPPETEIITADHTERQTTLIVRNTAPQTPPALVDAPHLDLEDLVLTYLHRAAGTAGKAKTPMEANR